jgi:hypothetical protein
MMPCCDRTIDGMIKDLLHGGWVKSFASTWVSPFGARYYGPHRAWHIWAGTPMLPPGEPRCPECHSFTDHKMDCSNNFNSSARKENS